MTREEREKIEKHFDELNDIASGLNPHIPDEIRAAMKAAYVAGADYALDTVQHWISVEDELPKIEEPYFDYNDEVCDDLKCSKKVIVFADNDFHIATLNQNYDDGEKSGKPYWFDEEHSEDGAWLDGKVTHWMPLPQAPKKGGEE